YCDAVQLSRRIICFYNISTSIVCRIFLRIGVFEFFPTAQIVQPKTFEYEFGPAFTSYLPKKAWNAWVARRIVIRSPIYSRLVSYHFQSRQTYSVSIPKNIDGFV